MDAGRIDTVGLVAKAIAEHLSRSGGDPLCVRYGLLGWRLWRR